VPRVGTSGLIGGPRNRAPEHGHLRAHRPLDGLPQALVAAVARPPGATAGGQEGAHRQCRKGRRLGQEDGAGRGGQRRVVGVVPQRVGARQPIRRHKRQHGVDLLLPGGARAGVGYGHRLSSPAVDQFINQQTGGAAGVDEVVRRLAPDSAGKTRLTRVRPPRPSGAEMRT